MEPRRHRRALIPEPANGRFDSGCTIQRKRSEGWQLSPISRFRAKTGGNAGETRLDPMFLSFQVAIIFLIAISPILGALAAHAVLKSCGEEHHEQPPEQRKPHPGAGMPRDESCEHGLRKRGLLSPIPRLRILRRSCHAPTHMLYPAMGLAFLILGLWAARMKPPELILPGLALGWILIALFAFDVTGFVLPNLLNYALLLSGLGFAASEGMAAAQESAGGVLAGGASLMTVKLVYRFVAGRDGLGLGDVKLFAAAGAWAGIEGLPQVLLIACLTGFVFAAIYLRRTGSQLLTEKVPFGAGLCIGLWVTWNFGPFLRAGTVS